MTADVTSANIIALVLALNSIAITAISLLAVALSRVRERIARLEERTRKSEGPEGPPR